MPLDMSVHGVGREMLAGFVRRLLGSESAEVEVWTCARLDYPAVQPITAGLYRFSGTARDRDRPVTWSLILKVVCSPAGAVPADRPDLHIAHFADPSSLNYWRREHLLYQSGLLDGLADGMAAPRCLSVVEQANDTAWLWLEDVADVFDRHWPLSHYGLVARHLGRFNGAYLTGRRLPAHPWLSRGLLRGVATARGAAALTLIARAESWEHPLTRRVFPASISVRLLRLWEERAHFHDALARLPQTFCHFDASRHNLIARHREDGGIETVGIDWAVAGIGAVGEEINLLVPSPFFRMEHDVRDLADHEERVFEGYVEGLHDAGWRGDERDVRLGYAASVALRTAFIAPTLSALVDDGTRTAEERRWGRHLAEILAQRAELTSFLLDRADEARALLNTT